MYYFAVKNLNYFFLDLQKKLAYREADVPPFTFPENAEELLIIFKVDDNEGKSIEPDMSKLLGEPCGIGILKKESPDEGAMIELPAGKYFFSQVREILNDKDSAELAAEVQKEALWERRKLGSKMYLRYLYEHGGPVTQIFRELQV